jgi:S-adenosylmethionine:tRNA ribosyltransferase-isomerase
VTSRATADYHYDLPTGAIAQAAIEPRDSARLLVAATLDDRRFSDLPELLAPGDLLVVNRTRVRAARLRGAKAVGGGAVEVLLLRRRPDQIWEALIKPARRIRPGIGLDLGDLHATVLAGPEAGMVVLSLESDGGDVEDAVAAAGTVPLPPYFHGVLDDPERYQTVFATTVGSAAAPTAGLHFTPRLLDRLAARGVERTEVDLEVGLDTFRPMTVESINEHTMHRERYEVPEAAVEAVAAARGRGGRVVAVGTTVVRTLETAGSRDGLILPGTGESDLFITPGYRFGVVDAVITNFHAPRSTLIVMVAAMLGEHWRTVYRHALAAGYRFLSFGDAMYIESTGRR